MFCKHCGKELPEGASVCDVCGTPSGGTFAPAQPAKVRKDFSGSPAWAKAVSVIGFALALLTLAFVWVTNLAPYTYALSAVGLILCMIAMATRNRNAFSLAGMIMNICIVCIGSIQIAFLVNF